ncbi:MAG: SpoIIE family protein phosphatase [Proteobacteria bacterium]|nr:SpoIIE family protein phosphatase [Pseudomonadota bacterium]
MTKRSGFSISVKMILTSTLLILLTVAGFGIMNVLNIRDVYDTTAEEKIDNFRAALARKGETTTQVFAQAMVMNLINHADNDIQLIVEKTATQDPELKLIYILSRDKRVVTYCRITRDTGQICDPERYRRDAEGEAPHIDEASWQKVEEIWRERIAAGKSETLVGFEFSHQGRPMQIFAYPVFSGGQIPTPTAALAREPGDYRQGFVILGYDLEPIARFTTESQRKKQDAEGEAIVRTGAVGFLFVLIGTVLAIIQGLSISKPLKTLAWKADRIANGDLEARVDVSSTDEIGLLAKHFNLMADRLVVLLQQTREKAKLEKELEVVRTIQETLVPPNDPVDCGFFNFAGFFQPASHCGGDWWTYHVLKHGKILLVIGDVTGHGVPSAMITATAKASCDVARAVHDDDVAVTTLLEIMNQAIFESARRRFVMTCFASIVDPNTRTITYANAGHNFPYLYRLGEGGRGEFGSLMIRGNRLGDVEGSTYEAKSTHLRPGDTLVWYTDGIVECENRKGEEYGERRFRASIREAAHLDASDLRTTVVNQALSFYGKGRRKDDITMIVGRVT